MLLLPGKRTALLVASTSRFSLRFFAAVINPAPVSDRSRRSRGTATSVPDAIITKAYAPILATGLIFGAIAGWIVGRWAWHSDPAVNRSLVRTRRRLAFI